MAGKPDIPALTGLRGIAALLVVLDHFPTLTLTEESKGAFSDLLWMFSTGGFAMTLFFTLSGFVITYNYLSLDWQTAPGTSLLTFIWLRVTRLYPALLIFMVGSAIANSLRALDHPITWTVLHGLSIETWIPIFAHGTIPSGTVYGVGWSVSTEIGMYLMFALLLILRNRVGPVWAWTMVAFYGVAIFYLSIKFNQSDFAPNSLALLGEAPAHVWSLWFFHCSPYFRILQFALGALAALVFMQAGTMPNGRMIAAVSVVLLVLLFIVRERPIHSTGIFLLGLDPVADLVAALLFALIIFNAADQTSGLNRVLSNPLFATLGTISYSLYLFHPFVLRLGIFSISVHETHSVPALAALLLSLAGTSILAVILAYAMYHLVEAPAKRVLRSTLRTSSPTAAKMALLTGRGEAA